MSGADLKLYEYGEQIETVRQWVFEHEADLLAAGGDLDALPELRDLLDQAEGQFDEKAERVALYIRELLVKADSIDASAGPFEKEAEHIHAKARARRNTAESLKSYLKEQLIRADRTKVAGKLVTVQVRQSPPKVMHTLTMADMADLGATGFDDCVRFVPPSYALESRAVLDRWKRGDAVPTGIYVTQGTHVRII